MAHIQLPNGLPGIIGPLKAYPETAKPLNELADLLLTNETPTFSKAERETVANYVSYLNDCQFCSESHAAVADHHWNQPGLSKKVWQDPEKAQITEKLKALLRIAKKVQKAAKTVNATDIEQAKKTGSTERDIHDTVLIAAAFCLYNRYVDGLGTLAPPPGDPSYTEIGKMLAQQGYQKAKI